MPNKNESETHILIKGAREHNLKAVSLDIPRDSFVVITGLSGSGKSSLAFDTLYAEGQRRYVDVLSPYSKQFMTMLKKPEVDSIEGLSPAISIEQKSISTNPRSTVGTVTEIYDYIRLLFAKIGIQYSLESNLPVIQKSQDQIIDEIIEKYSGKKVVILAPLVKARKGHYRDLFEQLMRQGFTKVRVDGEIIELYEEMKVSRYKTHDIDLVIDRLVIEKSHLHRINESVELALSHGEGILTLLIENNEEELFSTLYSDPVTGKAYDALAPNMFSFNSPYGSCKKCDGLGEIRDFNLDFVMPDENKSIENGAIEPLGKKRDTWLWNQVSAFAEKNGINLKIPIKDLPKKQLNFLLNGNGQDLEYSASFSSSGANVYRLKFDGILNNLMHLYYNPPTQTIKKSIEQYLSAQTCPECNGARLKKESLAVKIHDLNIFDLTNFDIIETIEKFKLIQSKLSAREKKIADVIIKEILERLEFLINVGLSYLTLSRAVKSLSGGESQRIRLASQIGSQLVGIMYVLDEPSIGLHQHDNYKLIQSLKNLRDLGNSVIVVEHDKSMIEESDFLIDIGPGAGIHGGEIILTSKPNEIKKLKKDIIKKSLTAQYLLKIKQIQTPEQRREGNGKYLILTGANGNNLKNVTLKLPLGKLICITGMSGSGKSSLINDTLYPILSRHFYKNSNQVPLQYSGISGIEHIDKVIEIDQTPIGKTPRSNPATYTGIFTLIRDLFAILPESKVRGYKPGRFSFNVPGGRCEECMGAGLKKIEMNFLPDVYVRCDTCDGKRYNQETLGVKYNGYSISDVLDMTVEESLEIFKDIPKLKRKIKTLNDVGLGYIKLGQQAPTLSGGEAQRVKLATELSKQQTGKTLYLLDEPTTGLHFEDINILLKLLDKLVDKGNTIVVIEHNLDVVKHADWVIDLGPEGGSKGGEIIAEGTPEQIITKRKSLTGKYLKAEL